MGASRYVVARSTSGGWATMTTFDALTICDDRCIVNINWRLGITEIRVFGVFREGEAVPLGEQPVYTFR